MVVGPGAGGDCTGYVPPTVSHGHTVFPVSASSQPPQPA